MVAGLLRNEAGHVLLSQRTSQQSFSGHWELPGGKVEPGERPELALQRELREELGIEAHVGTIYEVVFYPYRDFDLLMLVYHCTTHQMPRAIEVAQIAWVPIRELHQRQVLPADEELIKKLQQEE